MLRLHIDRARWDAHLAGVRADTPALVPVAKGNGYGLGNLRLAAEAAKLGADTLAVGTLAEAAALHAAAVAFERVVVLTPFLAGDPLPELPTWLSDRVVHTVAGVDAARALTGRRIVVECRTSLRRHGVEPEHLTELAAVLAQTPCEGFALHLPMNRPRGVNPVAEVATWAHRLQTAGLPTTTMYVSHLSGGEVRGLAEQLTGTALRCRIGTRLWLGDRGALTARARVLDVEKLSKGQRYGYRQRKAPGEGHLVVVAGGTAHGIGLASPKSVTGLRGRAKIAAETGLAATNKALSPFHWEGKQRWFAEPPHMQVSLLWVPGSVDPPAVGSWLDVDTRMTTTTFDEIVED
ncbi:MAG: alanine racemase [Sporichthyaceae bacterium]